MPICIVCSARSSVDFVLEPMVQIIKFAAIRLRAELATLSFTSAARPSASRSKCICTQTDPGARGSLRGRGTPKWSRARNLYQRGWKVLRRCRQNSLMLAIALGACPDAANLPPCSRGGPSRYSNPKPGSTRSCQPEKSRAL